LVDLERIVERCREILAEDHLAARLMIGALVQRLLQDAGYRSIVVGGTAVDAYVSGALGTSDAYPSKWEESFDLDTLVMRGLSGVPSAEAVAILEAHGFHGTPLRAGARHPGVDIVIDFVGYGLPDDYSPDHVNTIFIQDWEDYGLAGVLVAGAEDILFDYMESGWHMHHQRDWARALAITAVMGDQLDLGYLFSKAHWRMLGTYVEPNTVPLMLPPP
jgi:hypothetical protein